MCYMTLLNLESNPIKSWEEVINLGHLPRLKRLILNNTGIILLLIHPLCQCNKTIYLVLNKSFKGYRNKKSENSFSHRVYRW